ncbi:MAG: hypothetical protein KF752_07420 [Pirellulaceae bacterium]|nr:hypothetical protein [Pirellulaceae bacterium]
MISQLAAWLLTMSLVGQIELETDELRPGLVAEYRSVSHPEVSVLRLDAKPALTLGDSSPHPRIPPGPINVTWNGAILIQDSVTFSAYVGGAVSVTVDGQVVLQGTGRSDDSHITASTPLKVVPGYHRLVVSFRSLPGVAARLQLWWQGESFASEPLAAWRLGHLAEQETPQFQFDQLAEQGRIVIERAGCARCHAGAFPSIDFVPGPALIDAGQRLNQQWLVSWLADPSALRPDAHMPAVFSNDHTGFVERWLVADWLTNRQPAVSAEVKTAVGDHRNGRLLFMNLGCATCHWIPDDVERQQQPSVGQRGLADIADRMSPADIAGFLRDPHVRFPDGRMPRIPVQAGEAVDLAAYLLLWSRPTLLPKMVPPTQAEIIAVLGKLGVNSPSEAAQRLIVDRGCVACHSGLGDTRTMNNPMATQAASAVSDESSSRQNPTSPDTLANCRGARYSQSVLQRAQPYLSVAASEHHPSPYSNRQRRLARAGCVKCHQRDSSQRSPLEVVGSAIVGAYLQEVPFQRAPRLTNPHQKLTREHLLNVVSQGTTSLRGENYSYRMPHFGDDAHLLVQALAEADGEIVDTQDAAVSASDDPTLATLHGAHLAGFQGYACVSCHVWNGKLLGAPDPIAIGPDLTRTLGRVRRDWFDRFVESPMRFAPNTPMPDIFPHGQPATLAHILDGDSDKQKAALWAYLSLGKDAPSPTPPLPVPVQPPREGVIVAQIPIRLPDGSVVDSISVLNAHHDLLVYDLRQHKPVALFVGGQIQRNVIGRIRQFLARGQSVPLEMQPLDNQPNFLGYHRLADGVRLIWSADKEFSETIRLVSPAGGSRQLIRDEQTIELPDPEDPAAWPNQPLTFPDAEEGSLERPGYRAVMLPRPKIVSGEDRIMAGALAVHPTDGRVFVVSLKTGELLVFEADKNAFELYGQGLYQDALSMLAEEDAIYILHRGSLTKIIEQNGQPWRFERQFALTHGIADSYDMAYGLCRDQSGAFVISYAPYANQTQIGSSSAIRLRPGQPPEEFAFGMRNPLGWCSGPGGEVFFTDNQGEWVATNKLCHATEGKYFGWFNNSKPGDKDRPRGQTTVWIPYAWARSINGVAYENTQGNFGPFAGQLFMAELMFGGAIIRANVEEVNGVYQGACFPFWNKGLLGPLTIAFDPRGTMYVGSITEPGWMAQPDRGALFRIDFTGQIPFEMQSIHARPTGFRIRFTAPVNPSSAADPASYALESYRYEYTGAYGSPELDRRSVKTASVTVADDRMSVDLVVSDLEADRVFMLKAPAVRSAAGEPLVFPAGAYTLNEIPNE